MLAAQRSEAVHRPQGGVDRAQHRRQGALVRPVRVQRRTLARGGIGGHQRAGQVAQGLLRRCQAVVWPGIGRAFAASGDFPHHATAARFVEQLAHRRAAGIEYLQAFVQVVGHEEAGDRIDLQRRFDLVHARLDAFGSGRGACLDQPEQPARRSQQARRQSQCARLSIQRSACRRTHGIHGHVERATERVEQSRAGELQPPGEQGMRGVLGHRVGHAGTRGRAAQAVARAQSKQLVAQAVERGGHHVQAFDRIGQRAIAFLQGIVDLPGACPVQRLLLLQPVVDGRMQRLRRTRGEGRAAAHVRTGALDRQAGVLQVDRAQRPGLQAGRIQSVDGDFPFQPQRYPRLRPGGDADRIGVGALEQREAAHLVGDPLLLLPGAGARLLARGHRTRRRGPRQHRIEGHGGAVVGAVAAVAQHRFGLEPFQQRGAPGTWRRECRGDPLVVVRVLQQGLARQRQHLRWQRTVAERGDEAVGGDHPVDGGDHVAGPAAGELAIGREAAVAAVAQAASGAAHGQHRLGRERMARRGPVDDARLGGCQDVADAGAGQVADQCLAGDHQRRARL